MMQAPRGPAALAVYIWQNSRESQCPLLLPLLYCLAHLVTALPEDDIIDFSLQHTFDFSQSQGYILRASVSGGLQKLQECLGIRPDGLTGSGEQKHFESAVMALTKIYGDSGLYEIIEALFAL